MIETGVIISELAVFGQSVEAGGAGVAHGATGGKFGVNVTLGGGGGVDQFGGKFTWFHTLYIIRFLMVLVK